MRRFTLCLVVLLAPGLIGAAERQSIPGPEFASGWILVRMERPLTEKAADGTFLRSTPLPALNALIEARGIATIETALPVSTRHPRSPASMSRHGLDRLYKFHVPAGIDVVRLAQELSGLPGVDWAEPDFIKRPGRAVSEATPARDDLMRADPVTPDDPLFDDQWGLHQESDCDVDAPEGWATATGEGTVVAVIDTGVDLDHEDLVGQWVPGCGSPSGPCWDFIDNDPVPEDYPGGAYSGHGTNSASMIGASTDNGIGVAGLCWGCRLMPLRVWDQHGTGGTASRMADAVIWATDHDARVIHLPAQGPNPSLTELSAIAYAADAGAIFVTIAGSGGTGGVLYPGRYAETIAVGATNQWDEHVATSHSGPEIDVVAPGRDILSADLDDTYLYWSGTCYAAPFVSGLTAIMRSMNPSLGREEARYLVQAGADDQVGDATEDTPGFDLYHGWGRVNLERTLQAAASSVSLRVEGSTSSRLFFESPNALADSYDFVRGNLGAFTEGTMGVGLGEVVCLEDDSPDADTAGGNEDDDIPSVGKGYFYLARFNAAPGAGSYGGSTRNRDRFVADWDWSAEGDQEECRFGFAVDSAGDVNGDGYDDVIVGAYTFDTVDINAGAAYVFLGSAEGLEALPAWSAYGEQASAIFGVSVGSAGDVNGDGYDDVIVGAQWHDAGQTNEGRVYVHHGSASGLSPTPDWSVDGEQANALLGFRVGTAGDVNNDGYDDVIITARLWDGGQTDEGRSYLYHGSASGLPSTPDWTFETNQTAAEITAVATAGDVNCDGYDDVIVGSRKFDNGEIDEGRVYVFHGSGHGLRAIPSTILEINVAGAEFGFSANTAGNVDDDGCDDVIVGAHLYTDGETAEGGVFVFLGWPTTGLVTTPAWSFQSDRTETRVGQAAKTAGDVNGDGYDDVIVGGGSFDELLSYGNGDRTDEGQAWVFLGSSSGLASAPAWTQTGRQTTAWYGWAASAAGNVNGDAFDDIIVGAHRHDADQVDAGRAYVFHGPVLSSDCATETP